MIQKNLIEIENYKKELESKLNREIRLTENSVSDPGQRLRIGFNGHILINILLLRSLQLTSGLINGLNTDNAVLSFLATRAQFETTGTIAYLYKKLESFYANKIDLNSILIVLDKLLLGFKQKNIPIVPPEAVNVLTQIDTVDELKIFPKNQKKFRSMYESLSEFSHPNYCSFKLFVEKHSLNNYKLRYPCVMEQREFDLILTSQTLSQIAFLFCFNSINHLLSTNERDVLTLN